MADEQKRLQRTQRLDAAAAESRQGATSSSKFRSSKCFSSFCLIPSSHPPAPCIPGHGSQSLPWHWMLLLQLLSALSPKHSSQTFFSPSEGIRKTHSKQKHRALQSELEITDALPLVFPASTLPSERFHSSGKVFEAVTSLFILPLTQPLQSD